jgi:hypothetical protein
MTRITTILVALAALSLAACGGGSPSSSAGAPKAITIGAITATSAGTVTVNGIPIATAGATIRMDGALASEAALQKGMVATARGTFDDHGGRASEIELRHEMHGAVDDKGTDFLVVGGRRVHVDDSTEVARSGGFAALGVGSVVAISGVADDDKGGLRASRIDDSSRAPHDFDVKGFVANLVPGTSFQLEPTPDSTSYYLVTITGLTLPAGVQDGAYVEVHTLVPLVAAGAPLGTIAASAIELEDRFHGEKEIEVEGIVSSGDSSEFFIDGVKVQTSAATRWELGAAGDLMPGVKVEAEGSRDSSGVLQAHKVKFRPGVRITAPVVIVSGQMTVLGVPVTVPSFVRLQGYTLPIPDGTRVEVRGNPNKSGGIVALRIDPPSGGNDSRVFLRAVVTSKSKADESHPSFDVLGFTVDTSGVGANGFKGEGDVVIGPAAFYSEVTVDSTVIKARGASPASVSGNTFSAQEVELEGND